MFGIFKSHRKRVKKNILKRTLEKIKEGNISLINDLDTNIKTYIPRTICTRLSLTKMIEKSIGGENSYDFKLSSNYKSTLTVRGVITKIEDLIKVYQMLLMLDETKDLNKYQIILIHYTDNVYMCEISMYQDTHGLFRADINIDYGYYHMVVNKSKDTQDNGGSLKKQRLELIKKILGSIFNDLVDLLKHWIDDVDIGGNDDVQDKIE